MFLWIFQLRFTANVCYPASNKWRLKITEKSAFIIFPKKVV